MAGIIGIEKFFMLIMPTTNEYDNLIAQAAWPGPKTDGASRAAEISFVSFPNIWGTTDPWIDWGLSQALDR